MKFITVRDLRTSPAKIWKELPEEQEMVITNNGKPIALLTPITDRNLEETLATLRRVKAINALKLMQRKSVKNKNNELTMGEIEDEIQKARSETTVR